MKIGAMLMLMNTSYFIVTVLSGQNKGPLHCHADPTPLTKQNKFSHAQQQKQVQPPITATPS